MKIVSYISTLAIPIVVIIIVLYGSTSFVFTNIFVLVKANIYEL